MGYFLILGFLAPLLLFAAGFLQWRLKRVHHPQAFLKDRFLTPIGFSLVAILLAVIIVNIFFPADYNGGKAKNAKNLITDQNLEKQLEEWFLKPDTQRAVIRQIKLKGSSSPYTMTGLENYYERKTELKSPKTRQLGHYYLGYLHYLNNQYGKALNHLKKLDEETLPFTSHFKGTAYFAVDSFNPALSYLRGSHQKGHKYSDEAALMIFRILSQTNKDLKLANFLQETDHFTKIPNSKARKQMLKNGFIGTYTIVLGQIWANNFTLKGFLLALIITLVWGYFLWKIDIHDKAHIFLLSGIFFLGILTSFFTFYLSDWLTVQFDFSLTGAIWNDLAYSIIGIGLIEEFVKILPLLLILGFTRWVNQPFDYLLMASCSALGFAFVENIQYFQEGAEGTIIGRTIMSTVFHMIASSVVAYSLVRVFYRNTKIPALLIFLFHWVLAAFMHGLYNFLLFHGNIIAFLFNLILLIFYVRVWTILLNNCLNNSSLFDYQTNRYFDAIRFNTIVFLSGILALDYLVTGWNEGASTANGAIWKMIISGGFMIGVLGINLSRFDLIPGFWRKLEFWPDYEEFMKLDMSKRTINNVKLVGIEGAMDMWGNLIKGNMVYPKNFVGRQVVIQNYPYNDQLVSKLNNGKVGSFQKRVILEEKTKNGSAKQFPDWFVLKLEEPILIDSQYYTKWFLRFRKANPYLNFDKDLLALLVYSPYPEEYEKSTIQKDNLVNMGWVVVNKLFVKH